MIRIPNHIGKLLSWDSKLVVGSTKRHLAVTIRLGIDWHVVIAFLLSGVTLYAWMTKAGWRVLVFRHWRLKKESTMILVLAPPHAYDHPYRGHVIERVMPLAQARALCGKRGASGDACSWTEHGTCYVVLPRGGPVKSLASYRRHEVAHCNGWPASHPQF